MVQVYLGLHQRTGELVAVKELRTDSQQQTDGLQNELHLLAKLPAHPNVVAALGLGSETLR